MSAQGSSSLHRILRKEAYDFRKRLPCPAERMERMGRAVRREYSLYRRGLSMKQSQTKKVYIYPVTDTDGTPLDLINVLTYVSDGGVRKSAGQEEAEVYRAVRLDRVDTFIGRNDRGEYVKVGSTENLSGSGVLFRYASYVREQESLVNYYLECYHRNLRGLIYTEKGAYYVSQAR